MKNLFIFISSIFIILFLLPTEVSADINWIKHSQNPIINVGAQGSWDSDFVLPGDVIFDDSIFKMWYVGKNHDGREQIGFATSEDGITWNKYSDNPVLEVGTVTEWDRSVVKDPRVILDNGTFKMWYMGYNGIDERYQIGYATSIDGVNWTKYFNNPILHPSNNGWDDRGIAAPEVIKINNNDYRMWYSAISYSSSFTRWKIGYATSEDGIIWNRPFSNPVLVTSQSWETNGGDGIGSANVIYNDSVFHMWYHTSGIGYAASLNGINWIKYNLNPVISRGASTEWDSFFIIGTALSRNL